MFGLGLFVGLSELFVFVLGLLWVLGWAFRVCLGLLVGFGVGVSCLAWAFCGFWGGRFVFGLVCA